MSNDFYLRGWKLLDELQNSSSAIKVNRSYVFDTAANSEQQLQTAVLQSSLPAARTTSTSSVSSHQANANAAVAIAVDVGASTIDSSCSKPNGSGSDSGSQTQAQTLTTPVILAVIPGQGPPGSPVMIFGNHFMQSLAAGDEGGNGNGNGNSGAGAGTGPATGASVVFGSKQADRVKVQNARCISCIVPAQDASASDALTSPAVDVTVNLTTAQGIVHSSCSVPFQYTGSQ